MCFENLGSNCLNDVWKNQAAPADKTTCPRWNCVPENIKNAKKFLTTTTDYINWLLDNKSGKTCLVKKLNTEKMNND